MMVPNGFTDWARPDRHRRLHGREPSIRACGSRSRRPAPTGSRTAATSTRVEYQRHQRHQRAHERADLGPGRRHQPRRSQDRLAHREEPDAGDRAGGGRLVSRHGHAGRPRPLRQPRPAPGAEICGRPRADDQDAVLGLRHRSATTTRSRAAIPTSTPSWRRSTTIPTRPRFHFKKAGLANPKIVLQTSDAAFNGAVDMATLLQANGRQVPTSRSR